MKPSITICLSVRDRERIISHYASLKDTYATDDEGYSILNECLKAVKENRLEKADLIKLKDIKNGQSLVKMIIKDAYGHDMSEYIDAT